MIPKRNENSGLRTLHARAGHLWTSPPPSISCELNDKTVQVIYFNDVRTYSNNCVHDSKYCMFYTSRERRLVAEVWYPQ